MSFQADYTPFTGTPYRHLLLTELHPCYSLSRSKVLACGHLGYTPSTLPHPSHGKTHFALQTMTPFGLRSPGSRKSCLIHTSGARDHIRPFSCPRQNPHLFSTAVQVHSDHGTPSAATPLLVTCACHSCSSSLSRRSAARPRPYARAAPPNSEQFCLAYLCPFFLTSAAHFLLWPCLHTPLSSCPRA